MDKIGSILHLTGDGFKSYGGEQFLGRLGWVDAVERLASHFGFAGYAGLTVSIVFAAQRIYFHRHKMTVAFMKEVLFCSFFVFDAYSKSDLIFKT